MTYAALAFRAAVFALALCILPIWASAAWADAPAREPLDEALWTGPLLAAAAGSLPKGHVLFEPYLYDAITTRRFDSHGDAHRVARSSAYGSQSYLNYGLFDRVTVGMIPRFGYNHPAGGRASSGVGLGDLSLQAQYRLTQFQEGHWLPTTSVNVQETLPTGRYDRLERASDGFGAGAHTTTVSLYTQTYFWLANGRILRTRLNLSYAQSDRVKLADVSVYGTPAGFRGHAGATHAAFGDLAFEYSATPNWVAALDLWYGEDAPIRVSGTAPAAGGGPAAPYESRSGTSRVLYVAPAIEYNWNANVGVIVGARLTPAGRNTAASVTPVMAINYVY